MENGKITKTYLEVKKFQVVAQNYRKKVEGGKLTQNATPKTKLEYAIDRVLMRLGKAMEHSKIEVNYNDRLEDIRVDNCAVIKEEGKEAIILKGGERKDQYEYTAEADKKVRKLMAAENDNLYAMKVEFEPYMATIIPKNLTIEQEESFRGFVIPEDYQIPEPDEAEPEKKTTIENENGVHAKAQVES